MKENQALREEIIDFSKRIGFHLVGFTTPEVEDSVRTRFINWIQHGKHAELWYLEDEHRLKLRFNPDLLLSGVRSIIVFGVSYRDNLFGKRVQSHRGYISIYALRQDYHTVIKKKLKEVANFILERRPSSRMRIFVDSAPVLERYFAYKAGLGFIGKNNFLINPLLGSLIFLGEIFTDLEFESSSPLFYTCGRCSNCIDSCPTGALKPYEIDLNLCISYHTIENRENTIPNFVSERMKNMVFGCDLCALNCPYNKKDKEEKSNFFGEESLSSLQGIPLTSLLEMNEDQFKKTFKGTPILRVGYFAFLRNVIIAARNSGNKDLIEYARKKCALESNALVRKSCIELGLLD